MLTFLFFHTARHTLSPPKYPPSSSPSPSPKTVTLLMRVIGVAVLVRMTESTTGRRGGKVLVVVGVVAVL